MPKSIRHRYGPVPCTQRSLSNCKPLGIVKFDDYDNPYWPFTPTGRIKQSYRRLLDGFERWKLSIVWI